MLEYLLRRKTACTLTLRQECEVMHPAQAVMDLRKSGHEIVTNKRLVQFEDAPRRRLVAFYSHLSFPPKPKAN